MKSSSLYQKYRPKNFSQIIGQKYVIKTLINSIKMNNVGHAYIFSGPKGIGKTTIAKIFSKAINCLDFKDDICEKCENCELIASKNTVDILELDAASNNGVDDIRKILESTKFLPNNLKYKVYIIDEAHMLTNSAWNAFLKTLEEPPLNVVFIFATTEMYKIPPTIVSRCQCFDFAKLSDEQIITLISSVNEKEGIKANKSAILTITNLAGGSARDALSMLEQAMLCTNNNITDEALYEMFGLIDNNEKINFIKLLIDQNVNSLINKIDEYQQRGINFSQFVLSLSNLLLDLLIYLQTKDLSLLKYLPVKDVNAINLSKDKIVSLINIFQRSYNEMKNNDDLKLLLEIMIFQSIEVLNAQNIATVEQQPTKTPTQSIQKPNAVFETKQQTSAINKTNELPPISFNEEKIFSTNDISVNIPQSKLLTSTLLDNERTEEQVELTPTNKTRRIKADSEIQNIAIAIITNRTMSDTSKAKKILSSLIEESELDPLFSRFSSGCKVTVASKNGIIFQFDDELDASWLNANYDSKKIQEKIIKFNNQPLHLIGSYAKQLKEFQQYCKLHKDEKLPEPSIEKMQDDFKSDNLINDLADRLFR